jgi:AhpD family alkylhydroperoxidase
MTDQTTTPSNPAASHQHVGTPVSYGKAVQAELREPSVALRRAIPDVYEGFKGLHDAAYADGALPRKTKELMALAIAVNQHCDGCIASHSRAAARAGATEAEVAETLGVCIQMMGGPGTVYAPRAFAAFREFAGG